jgi:CheY-like chemotaxis protein
MTQSCKQVDFLQRQIPGIALELALDYSRNPPLRKVNPRQMVSKRRILCVDDHEDTCDLIATVLSEYDVTSEHSKAGGLCQASTEKFSLILLDYHLPDGTGLELCVLIRSFDPNVPILLVTGTSSITRHQVLAIGGQGLVRKDKIPELLPVEVSRLLN